MQIQRYKSEVEAKLRELAADQAAEPGDPAASAANDSEMLAHMSNADNVVGFHIFQQVLAAANDHTQDASTALSMMRLVFAIVRKQFPWLRKVIVRMGPTLQARCLRWDCGT